MHFDFLTFHSLSKIWKKPLLANFFLNKWTFYAQLNQCVKKQLLKQHPTCIVNKTAKSDQPTATEAHSWASDIKWTPHSVRSEAAERSLWWGISAYGCSNMFCLKTDNITRFECHLCFKNKISIIFVVLNHSISPKRIRKVKLYLLFSSR